jgi:hypothetical protein
MGRGSAGQPQLRLTAGALASLQAVVSPARWRCLRSLESTSGSGSSVGAALPMVGRTSTSACSRAARPSWRSPARSGSALEEAQAGVRLAGREARRLSGARSCPRARSRAR